MAFLTEDDLCTYAPSADVDDSSIIFAQATIEAWLGYPLEQAERVEILKLTTRSKTAQLSYWPIASTPTPVIEVRQGNERDRLDRQSVVTDWFTLATSDYILDDTGKLSLNILNSAVTFGFNLNYSTEVRATYTAGVDFSQDTAEVNALKAATGAVITYQTSPNFSTGVSEIDIDNHIRKKYSGSGSSALPAGQTPEILFRAFQKYKPRSMVLTS